MMKFTIRAQLSVLFVCVLLFMMLTSCKFSNAGTPSTQAPQVTTMMKNESAWSKYDFENDVLIVKMTHEASMKFYDYTPEDFSEIGCVRIDELTSATKKQVQAVLSGEENVYNVNPNTFKRVLVLELGEKTRENVLHSIALLEERNDVESVKPNLTFSLA